MTHEIRLYDVIGAWGMTAEALAASIPKDTDEITVRINSPGGAVSDGLAIYNYLRDHKAKVTTIVDGYAASAASIVMLAGDIRQVHESSIVVIHNPWTAAVGDGRDMRHTATVLDELRTALIGIYTERTGMSGDELEAALDDETWMRGPVAMEYGFADEIIRYDDEDEGQMAASVQFNRMLEIINGGHELMSKQLTRREIEAQAAETTAKLTEAEAAVEQARAESEQAQAALQTQIAELQARIETQVTEHAAKIDEINAALKAEQEARAEVEAARVETEEANAHLEKQVADVTADFEKAKAALANPAVADASINAPGALPNADLDAEADAAEAEAKAKAEADAPKDIAEEYEAMETGPARVAFWNAHKREIMKVMEGR